MACLFLICFCELHYTLSGKTIFHGKCIGFDGLYTGLGRMGENSMEIESIPCASGSFDNISIHSLFIMEATEQKNRLKKTRCKQ